MRGPLFILVPLAAIISTGVIGVSFGLANLGIREATDSALGPVVFAGVLTIVIMGVAAFLSIRSPQPEE